MTTNRSAGYRHSPGNRWVHSPRLKWENPPKVNNWIFC